MKIKFNSSLLLVFLLFCFNVFSQNQEQNSQVSTQTVESISLQMERIAKLLENLNLRMKNFAETFSSNQGLQLTEKQQDLLFAFEILNRAEQSQVTLQKSKVELTERQIAVTVKIRRNEEDSRTENINRSVAFQGSTDAETVRENRRQTLLTERRELNSLLSELNNRITELNRDIQQTEQFIKRIRTRIFFEAEKQIKIP